MITTLFGYILALFFLGLCIFVHELGHFLAARWRKLHIIAFSIGFKKIWSVKRNGIEYRIGCIPCGGYVDLPQIDATGEAKDEQGNPLPPVKPIDKIITAFAGPFFNILFGLLLSIIVWQVGVPQDTPRMHSITVEALDKNSPEFEAGLRDGDEIIKINGSEFYGTWSDFVRVVIFNIGDVVLTVKRDGKTLSIKYRPAPNVRRTPNEKIAYPFFIPQIPIKCEVLPGTPVEKAGMKTGDTIVEVNGLPVHESSELQQALSFNKGEEINFKVKRDGKIITLAPIVPTVNKEQIYRTGVTISDSFNAIVENTPGKPEALNLLKGDQILKIDDNVMLSENILGKLIKMKKGQAIEFLIKRNDKVIKIYKSFPLDNKKDTASELSVNYKYSLPIWINSILPGTPAAKQGLLKYDKILQANGKIISSLDEYIDIVKKAKDKPIKLVIERFGIIKNLTLKPELFYAYNIKNIGLKMVILTHPTPLKQFERVITMTYKSLRGIISKDSTLKPRHLSGPLGILNGISITFTRGGFMSVLAFIVLITYSLAIINLMPLPVLDGGHIVLAVIEQIRKKPMSPKIIQPVFTVFVILLISMMLYVSFYDLFRIKFLKSHNQETSVIKKYLMSNKIIKVTNKDNKK